jgi:hypothetical protein
MQTVDGTLVFPAFQFIHGDVITGLADILSMFDRSMVDDWTVAGWLQARHISLENLSVIDWLRQGKDIERVRQLIREAAWRFAW